ncbi:MAG: zinc-ribbon domain-containing protein [Ruminococcaceae bacterium]|nr:zinc-ribbon domain-containing protein [Oscillospiraceae bacterium]
MFCGNCGNQINDNASFCPNCGKSVTNSQAAQKTEPAQPFVQPAADNSTAAPPPPVNADTKPKKKKIGCLIAVIIGLVIALILGAIVTVTVLIIKSSGGGSTKDYAKDDKKNESVEKTPGYESEVKAYLDYIKDKNNDVDEYLEDTYFGGEFGLYYSGKRADEIHKIEADVFFEYEKDYEMEYGYGEYFDYDDWRDYKKESEIDYFYECMEDYYGDWDLSYEIVESKECSDAKFEDLEEIWDDLIDAYEEFYKDEDFDFSEKDAEEYDEFIEYLKDLEVTKAYVVKAEVEIEGEDDYFEDTLRFYVAKAGDQWVILEGTSFYDLT